MIDFSFHQAGKFSGCNTLAAAVPDLTTLSLFLPNIVALQSQTAFCVSFMSHKLSCVPKVADYDAQYRLQAIFLGIVDRRPICEPSMSH